MKLLQLTTGIILWKSQLRRLIMKRILAFITIAVFCLGIAAFSAPNNKITNPKKAISQTAQQKKETTKCPCMKNGKMTKCQCMKNGKMAKCQCMKNGKMAKCQCMKNGKMAKCQCMKNGKMANKTPKPGEIKPLPPKIKAPVKK